MTTAISGDIKRKRLVAYSNSAHSQSSDSQDCLAHVPLFHIARTPQDSILQKSFSDDRKALERPRSQSSYKHLHSSTEISSDEFHETGSSQRKRSASLSSQGLSEMAPLSIEASSVLNSGDRSDSISNMEDCSSVNSSEQSD